LVVSRTVFMPCCNLTVPATHWSNTDLVLCSPMWMRSFTSLPNFLGYDVARGIARNMIQCCSIHLVSVSRKYFNIPSLMKLPGNIICIDVKNKVFYYMRFWLIILKRPTSVYGWNLNAPLLAKELNKQKYCLYTVGPRFTTGLRSRIFGCKLNRRRASTI